MQVPKGSDVHWAISSAAFKTLCLLAASTVPGAYRCGLGSDVPDRPLYTTMQQACSHPAFSIDGTCLYYGAVVSIMCSGQRRPHLAQRGYIDSLQWSACTKLTRDGHGHRHSSLTTIQNPWGLGCRTDTGTARAMLWLPRWSFMSLSQREETNDGAVKSAHNNGSAYTPMSLRPSSA